jgi:predicted transcriptional regulator
MSSNAIFLSIRPQYADRIFKGTKTVELRRVRPKHIRKGTLVLVYVPSPIQSLVGAFKVDQVVEESLQKLWEMVHNKAGITREEFDTYYNGVSIGVGIFFSEVWHLPEAIELHDLKEQMIGFRPPQGFRYATTSELTSPRLAELVEDMEIIVQSSFLDSELQVK